MPYLQPLDPVESMIANYNTNGSMPQIATLIKMYSNPEHKYGGSRDVFDQKMQIFTSYCQQAGVPPDGLVVAFPNMLKGEALEFYFANLQRFARECLYLKDAALIIKNHFENEQHKINVLQQWNRLSFDAVAAENPDKTRLEQFDALEEKLRKLNLALPANMQNDNNTHSRLLLACEGNPTFKFACQNTTPRLTDLISSLRAAAASEDRTSKTGTEVMLTDRRYHKTYDNRQGHSYRDKPEYKRDRPYDRNRGREVNRNKGNYRRQNNDKC
jgi:hypothetical protein